MTAHAVAAHIPVGAESCAQRQHAMAQATLTCFKSRSAVCNRAVLEGKAQKSPCGGVYPQKHLKQKADGTKT